MPQVKNLNFPEHMFALSFLYTIEENFGNRKQQIMNELSIPRE